MTLRVATLITRLEGGAGQLTLRGVLSLAAADIEPVIVAGSGALLGAAAAAGVEVITEPALGRAIDPCRDPRALAALSALLRERAFDVAHTHTSKAGVLGRLAAHHAKVPRVVHTYHGFPFHEFQSGVRRAAYVAIERRMGQFTDVALCVGTGVAAEAIRRRLVPPERVRTIGVAVPAGLAPADAEARDRARRALGLPSEAVVIGTVGRLTYQKAPEDFVEVVRELRRRGRAGRPELAGLTGVWIGGGELAGRVARLIAKHADPGVLLAGERADVPGLLPALDMFVLPSRYEGLPTAVVEAMACGIPVVATAVNAVPDVVVPGETGLLVPPGRPDLLADAVAYLLARPELAARMAERARESLGHRFEISTLGAALIESYTRSSENVAMSDGSVISG